MLITLEICLSILIDFFLVSCIVGLVSLVLFENPYFLSYKVPCLDRKFIFTDYSLSTVTHERLFRELDMCVNGKENEENVVEELLDEDGDVIMGEMEDADRAEERASEGKDGDKVGVTQHFRERETKKDF